MRGGLGWMRTVAVVAVLGLVGGLGLAVVATPQKAEAITASELIANWDPGHIISDEKFYDRHAMTTAEIQAFLDEKIGTCLNGQCLNVLTVYYPGRPKTEVCEAIQGGTMSAAELIYRAQVGCGISAKALLVTLQKEQGLVTSRAPGDWALTAALGMACPDTAPCDSQFSGFATQVVEGARQLMAYRHGFGRQPGWNNIRWSVNPACGSSAVYIQNYATAALYNYTPYQPNYASLANPYRTGDACSQYGNRNFFAYYWDWFGSPVAKGGSDFIRERHEAEGGDGGAFGAPVGDYVYPSVVPGSVYREFANAMIFWLPNNGISVLTGAMLDAFKARGGAGGVLGLPYGTETAWTAHGVSGTYQYFTKATLYNSSTTGSYPVLMGDVHRAYVAAGGSTGTLGWPTSDESRITSNGGGIYQTFQGGAVAIRSGSSYLVTADLQSFYASHGGPAGEMGWPIANEVAWTASGTSGVYQNFQSQIVYSTATTGTHAVLTGPIRTEYGRAGGSPGPLGWPIADQDCLAAGDCMQLFEGGGVYSSSLHGAFAVVGDMHDHYTATGGPAGSLGWPVGKGSCDDAGECVQAFEAGLVTWSPDGGDTSPTQHEVRGTIETLYLSLGGPDGVLGAPTGSASSLLINGGGVWQAFQHGAIYVRHNGAAQWLDSAMLTYYLERGGPAGWLGWPVSSAVEWPANGITGSYQYFQAATVYDAGEIGIAATTGVIRNAYGAAGGSPGPLGWPTADAVCDGSGNCEQQFQGGLIHQSSGAAFAMTGAVRDKFVAEGGVSGWLGWPLGGDVAWTANGVTGVFRYFEHGIIYNAVTTGTVVVADGPIRTSYGDAGGSPGVLGWPTADAVCDGSGNCEQQFQGGAIRSVMVGEEPIAIVGPMLEAYDAAGGSLGLPSNALTPIRAKDGAAGYWQYFDGVRVIMYWTPSNGIQYLELGEVRTYFGALGGIAGSSLGFPVGAPTSDGGVVRQQFDHGTIVIEPGSDPRVEP